MNGKHRQMMAKLTESDKQRLEKAKNLYAIIAPHRMDHQNECPSDVQLVLMINRWINPWHACQDLEKIIPFKERQKIKEKMVTNSNISSIENDVKNLENDLKKIAKKYVGEEYSEQLKEKLNSEIVKTVLEKISDQTEIPMECLYEINSDGELF